MTVEAVWTIADIFNGLMALPNLIALVTLSGVVVKETNAYFERKSKESVAKDSGDIVENAHIADKAE